MVLFCCLSGWFVHHRLVWLWTVISYWSSVLCWTWYHYNKIWWGLCIHFGSIWTMSGIFTTLGKYQVEIIHMKQITLYVSETYRIGKFGITGTCITTFNLSTLGQLFSRRKIYACISRFFIWILMPYSSLAARFFMFVIFYQLFSKLHCILKIICGLVVHVLFSVCVYQWRMLCIVYLNVIVIEFWESSGITRKLKWSRYLWQNWWWPFPRAVLITII